MKELNILQAIEMSVGTEFNISDEENNAKVIIKSSDEFRNKLRENSTGFISKKFICWANTGKEITLGDYEASLKFIPIQKPVSFIEAVEASKEGKRLRVVHDMYCEIKEFKKIGKLFEMIISANKNFGDEIVNKAIIENILNGEWYIEEEN